MIPVGERLHRELLDLDQTIKVAREDPQAARDALKNRREPPLDEIDETLFLQRLLERKAELERRISSLTKEPSADQPPSKQTTKTS